MSKPNQCAELGRSRLFARSQLKGSCEVNKPGKAAITAKSAISADEMMNSGLCRSSRQASAHRLLRRPPTSPAVWAVAWLTPGSGSVAPPLDTVDAVGSLITDPRVQDAVEHVHQQVGRDVD